MKDNLISIVLSYFRYFGEEVVEFLEKYKDVETRRIVHQAMIIIEDGLYVDDDEDGVRITCEVPSDLEFPLKAFLLAYKLDKTAEMFFNLFNKENK